MAIQFTDICFITNDVLRLRTFYEIIFGVKAEGDEIHSSITLDRLTITIDFVEPLQKSLSFQYVSGRSSDNMIIGFNVDDVDAEYERLLLLDVEMLNQPTTHPWGAWSFQFKDSDGNILNFRSFPKGK